MWVDMPQIGVFTIHTSHNGLVWWIFNSNTVRGQIKNNDNG